MFVDMVRTAAGSASAAAEQAVGDSGVQVKGTRPADMPVYGQTFLSRQEL